MAIVTARAASEQPAAVGGRIDRALRVAADQQVAVAVDHHHVIVARVEMGVTRGV